MFTCDFDRAFRSVHEHKVLPGRNGGGVGGGGSPVQKSFEQENSLAEKDI